MGIHVITEPEPGVRQAGALESIFGAVFLDGGQVFGAGEKVALGDLPHGSIGYQTIFAAGLTLMLMTLSFNIFGFWLRRRYRERY